MQLSNLNNPFLHGILIKLCINNWGKREEERKKKGVSGKLFPHFLRNA
jgi:hypothetical protein